MLILLFKDKYANLLYIPFALIVLLAFSFNCYGQTRPTVAMVYLQSSNFKQDYYQVAEEFQHPAFYNHLPFSPAVIHEADELEAIDPNLYARYIEKHQLGNKVVATWFNRNENGAFSTETLERLALNSATDSEMKLQSSTSRGLNFIKDKGEPLLKSTYLLVIGASTYYSAKEMYDQIDNDGPLAGEFTITMGTLFESRPVARKKSGVVAIMPTVLYKLDWDEDALNEFYTQYWTDGSDGEKVKAFNSKAYTLTEVNRGVIKGEFLEDGYESSTYVYQVENALKNGMGKAVEQLGANQPAFDVNGSVFSVSPLRAKLGVKDNLKASDRFKIYETYEENGALKKRKKGVVIATGEIDQNTGVATGNSEGSRFKRITGGGFDLGMEMQKIPMAKLRLDPVLLAGDHLHYGARVYYDLSANLGWESRFNYGLYAGVFGYITSSYFELEDGVAFYGTGYTWGALLSKTNMLVRNLSLDIDLGVSFETHPINEYETFDDMDELVTAPLDDLDVELTITTFNLPLEASLSFYLTHAIRLSAGLGYAIPISMEVEGSLVNATIDGQEITEEYLLTANDNLISAYGKLGLVFEF